MAEWLKATVLKTVKGETSSRVRIPLSPQIKNTQWVFFICGEKKANFFAFVRIRKTERCELANKQVGVVKNFWKKFICDRISLQYKKKTPSRAFSLFYSFYSLGNQGFLSRSSVLFDHSSLSRLVDCFVSSWHQFLGFSSIATFYCFFDSLFSVFHSALSSNIKYSLALWYTMGFLCSFCDWHIYFNKVGILYIRDTKKASLFPFV